MAHIYRQGDDQIRIAGQAGNEYPSLIQAEWRIYTYVNGISIGSGNGLAPNRRQAITWTNGHLLSIGPFGNFSSQNAFQNVVRETAVIKMSSDRRTICL